MKFGILILTLLFASSAFSQENPQEGLKDQKENFDQFLLKFCTDSTFQINRIKFPLEFIGLDYNTYEESKSTIKKEDWKMDYIFMNDTKRSQIYDNFSMQLGDTDERLFQWIGIENGINILYYFKRIQGKWYLIKFKNTSD